MADGPVRHWLDEIVIDEVSLAPVSSEQEHERNVAVTDLIKDNYFEPEGGAGGPYQLRVGLLENRLDLQIAGQGVEARHLLSLTPFRRIVRDYMEICRSYNDALKGASPSQIESIDMGRRGLHNDGSDMLRERLQGKVKTDMATSRRLFTLICALHWRG
ncbi:MAG TPA: UPF0262 family protein [Caulobacteraceae bacterium]|nr:UPF0262 family protein [Caulobacteraceae bacterium]